MERKKLPAEFNFDQAGRAVMWQEGLGFLFQRVQIIKATGGEEYNEAQFEFHPEGLFPPPCVFQPLADPIPAGYIEEWAGSMLVEGREQDVRLVRQQ